MAELTREQRLVADFEALRALKAVSTLFDFEATGEPPDRYAITLRGKGLTRDMSSQADIEFIELHRCDVRLPYSYPDRPPDIRWLTPIFHPNISFSGFLDLRDVGLPWDPELGLDVVCERLWDVARLAYLNLDKATNYAAKNWFDQQTQLQLPLDHRPLRDKAMPAASNVVRYQRRGGRRAASPPGSSDADVLFIGEDTPAPELPEPPAAAARRGPPQRPAADDDVLFIGDE